MTDKQIYKLCRQYGAMSLKGRSKFVALLPEVAKRSIHRKYGFGSIYEFAAKLCGVSKNVVNEALRVYGKIKDKPDLLKQFKEQGINKVRLVANIATKETDKEWAEKVSTMTKPALETHVRDIRKSHPGMGITENVNSDLSQKQAQKSLFDDLPETSTNDYMSSYTLFKANLDPKTIQQLEIIKAKMGKGTTWNEAFEKILADATPAPKREYKTKASKTKSSKSRNISAKQKREMPDICEVPGCNKPAEVTHHTDRWALTKSHEKLVSLCRDHHELAHRGYLGEENGFKPLIKAIIDPIKTAIDRKMLGYLRGS